MLTSHSENTDKVANVPAGQHDLLGAAFVLFLPPPCRVQTHTQDDKVEHQDAYQAWDVDASALNLAPISVAIDKSNMNTCVHDIE